MRYLALLVGLALLVLAAGCTTQPTQAPEASAVTAAPAATTIPTTLPTTLTTTLPTTVPTTRPTTLPTTQAQRLDIQLNSIEDYVSDNPYTIPRPGYKFILVDFSIKNTGYPNGYSYNPFNIKVADPDGYRYGYSSSSYNVPGYFGMVVIPNGDTVRGKLLFEVPQAPSGTRYTLWVS